MSTVRARTELIRQFILNHVGKHPADISKITAQHFNITRQAIHKHLQKLIAERMLTTSGQTQNQLYKLCPLSKWEKVYPILPDLAEDRIWATDIRPMLVQLPANLLDIWHYGFTEMFNNAIDHSEGTKISVYVTKTAVSTEIILFDNGVGIFKKIQSAMNLLDERHAILELSKGKFTTDPRNHSGEGIFFTSRIFDVFDIFSGGVYFTHQFERDEDLIWENNIFTKGTAVIMKINNRTSRTIKKVFDQYAPSKDDYGFNKTVIPVQLAQYGNDKLISRSQAKRLLARVELFTTVIFDFQGVDSIGQAFADEIFRVFALKHPDIRLLTINTRVAVERMINRAKAVNL